MKTQWNEAKRFLISYSTTLMLTIVAEKFSPEWALCIAVIALSYIIVFDS